jgi:hypothetical protein
MNADIETADKGNITIDSTTFITTSNWALTEASNADIETADKGNQTNGSATIIRTSNLGTNRKLQMQI